MGRSYLSCEIERSKVGKGRIAFHEAHQQQTSLLKLGEQRGDRKRLAAAGRASGANITLTREETFADDLANHSLQPIGCR
jgi:hypothetical protein